MSTATRVGIRTAAASGPRRPRPARPCRCDRVRNGRLEVNGIAGAEPMVDAVDDEAELTGEDVGELLARVRVGLLDRVARLDRDEQGLEHAGKAATGEDPVRPLASRRELARPACGAHDVRYVSLSGAPDLGEEA